MKRTLIVAALLTAGLSAYGRSDPPPLAETLEFLHNAAASTVSANAPNSYSFDSHGCDVTIHDNGPIASTVHFSLRDVEPKWGLRGEHGMSVSGTLSPRVTTFSISTTQMRKKIRVDFDNGMDGFGILKWPTSAVCFGPPWAKRTSSLDLSDELGSGGGVGLESQGGVI